MATLLGPHAAAAVSASGPPQCQPLVELPRQGKNAKYVKDCQELHLGHKGLTHLSGFQSLVNLEVLWVNNNQLQCITNLDSNFRIKKLYAQNNSICTLKGSLLSFHFLDTLDLSGNQLRDLDKLMATLQKMPFLTYLNLQGNPCCEEPHYRSRLIFELPSLQVLDLHEVTTAERQAAKQQAGADAVGATIAFGMRVPADDGSWKKKTPAVSALEKDLVKRVGDIQQARAAEEYAATQRLYSNAEAAAYYSPRKTLPPPPGWKKAQEQWQQQTSTSGGSIQTATDAGGLSDTGSNSSSSSSSKCRTAKDVLVLYSWTKGAVRYQPQEPEKPWTRTCPPGVPGQSVVKY